MTHTFENDILFDDASMLENIFGKNYQGETAKNLSPDCDCTSYIYIEDDDNINSPQGARTAY